MARTVEGLKPGFRFAFPASVCLLLAMATNALDDITGTTDITPDAVTMATTHNMSTGEVAYLTDGRIPDRDSLAPAFTWNWIGLLAVSWPDTVHLAKIRVYLGEMSSYRLFGYSGGGFTEEGYRVGVETAAFGLENVVPPGTTGWYEITCAPEVAIDNLSFQVIGGAVMYEMQFLAPDGFAVHPEAKARARGIRGSIGDLWGMVRGLLD